jgi:hypothetical protein
MKPEKKKRKPVERSQPGKVKIGAIKLELQTKTKWHASAYCPFDWFHAYDGCAEVALLRLVVMLQDAGIKLIDDMGPDE